MSADLDRTEFKNANGLARFWTKDGLWHVARPRASPVLLYTAESYATREQAIAALQDGNPCDDRP